MSKKRIEFRLMLVTALLGIYTQSNSQSYFKEYIDSDMNCDEFNTQVFVKNDSIFLINFISCGPSLYHTNILQYDLKGNYIKKVIIDDLVPNVYSAHLIDDSLFLAGVNNDENPDSKFILWNGNLNLSPNNVTEMELFDSSTEAYLNTMGSIGIDSNKVIYGQYSIENNPKVFSFLLWLKTDLSRDSLMVFDSSYDWSIISNARIDSHNNLYILVDAAKVVDHIVYNYRKLIKYNSEKDIVYEWVSSPFGVNEGIPSFTLLDSTTCVLEMVAEENGHIHSLVAINQESEIVWEHIFHIDDPKSLYRINDIITCKDGGILCCGTYRNVSENTIETGYVCKLDRFGNLLWERVFYDQEELLLPESGINKVIHFNSVVEAPDKSIVIGGRVIHKFLSLDSKSDVLLMVLDSNGCISNNCSTLNDITRIDKFLAPDKIWTEVYFGNEDSWSFKYRFDSISVSLGGRSYNQLLIAYSEFSENWQSTGTFIREEDNRLYEFGGGVDQIIYDFNIVKGDTFHLGNEFVVHDLVVEDLDTISLMNGDLKRRWTLQPIKPVDEHIDNTIIWIERIGNVKGLRANLLPWTFDWDSSAVLCVYLINSIVYDNPDVDLCWIMSTSTKEERQNNLLVVPNPAADEIRILGIDQKIEVIRIYNNLGGLVFEGQDDRIQLMDFPAGYYHVVAIIKGVGARTSGFIKM